jgi:hypothetical protein
MKKQTLELDKFFEKDIIEFLDEKNTKILGPGKAKTTDQDYNNLRDALRNNDTKIAVDILEESISKFNSLEMNNTYKEIIFEELLEMIELSRKYVSDTDDNSELSKVLKLLEESTEMSETLPERITAFEKIKVERAQKKIEEKEKEYQIQAKADSETKKVSQELFLNLRKKNLKEAMLCYRKLKSLFEDYPSSLEEEKQQFYNDLLAFYMQINKLKEELKQRQSEDVSAAASQKTMNFEQRPDNLPQDYQPEQIKGIMTQIKQDLEAHDFNTAKGRIIDLKQIVSKISDTHLKDIINGKIDTLNNKIDFLERASDQKT